eukprot:286620-Pelagomonas_calceolata.AAC.7
MQEGQADSQRGELERVTEDGVHRQGHRVTSFKGKAHRAFNRPFHSHTLPPYKHTRTRTSFHRAMISDSVLPRYWRDTTMNLRVSRGFITPSRMIIMLCTPPSQQA